MKLHFSYKKFPTIDSLYREASVKEHEVDFNSFYEKYLCGWLNCDIERASECNEIFLQIAELENHEREFVYGGGNAWFVTIYRDKVEFEFQLGSDDYPNWYCSLDEVKIALTGWQRFLEMPESLESQVEVDLP